ncbi:MAG: hypothetical protein WAL31_08145 [Gaiellaceae bacterium]
MTLRLPTEVPRERVHGIVFLSLVLLVEAAWAVALGCVVLHFV